MNGRKIFQDSITPLPEQTGSTSRGLMINEAQPEHGNEKMTVLFSLSMPGDTQQQLEEKVARGEVVPLDELQKNYTVDQKNIDALVSWLKKEGFEIKEISKDGTSVYAEATVNQISKSLEVKMVRVTKNGLTYNAAQNAPSLPEDAGEGVHAIIGLQPFRQAHKNFRILVPPTGNRMASIPEKESTPVPSPSINNAPPYFVNEILKAYNADGLNVTGKGQTIAILIDNFPHNADLKAFWKQNNLPVTLKQIQKINVKGGHLLPPEGEETLDTEWASGIAPGAKVRIYASGSLQFVDLDRALDRIISDLASQPGMRQLSISLGLGETYMGGPQGEVATQHQKFLRLAAAGVNVFVSSGDAGSNPDDTGHNSNGPLQAEYEASDPNVISVGGTSLKLDQQGNVDSESAWVGSGGGKSIFFNRPIWQKGPGVPAGNERLVPDVSVVADPETGAYLVLNNKVVQIGGTSWSAPVWAGFCALINEARIQAKKPALPFLNPLIYPLINTPAFRDVVSGNNGAYNAGQGYDMITGLGVPDIKELISAL
ncbi:MAG: S53 family peptidase [Bacteroidota bacterium]|nr:S53 family peptidase [Bacteroidota bacterium]